ncbi:phosphatidylserine/phosphatidylglycerophosphate/cardiolipin synthase family protein [Pelagibius sp.]|uniref:phospholipase D-like domain-containing protein n=1 Tax=Pelagibius sp. TaxID=1931238 RepID=UPI00261193F7|nr:phospholipase D-like domain-containing protein [Pelagibius sp.]
MPFNLNDRIEFHMGPSAIGAPDDLEAAIVDFIDRARDSLDVAIQEVESRAITEAFVRARQRGVRVRIVLEQDYLRAGNPPADPFAEGGAEDEENRALFAAMLRANIDARADYNPEIFHQKFIVRDSGKSRRALLAGSTNFTPTGVGRNLNHVVILHDQRVCNEYDLEFEEIWTGTFGRKRNRHDPSPRNNRVAGLRVRALFAPDHAPEMEIMKQILKARERIDFAIFTFSQSSGIDDALVAMSQAGLTVRGIFDSGQGNRDWAATRLVANAGGEAFLASRKNGLGKLHHKLMVIDSSLVIAGSFNYTGPANRLNDENILLIGDLDEDDPDAQADQEALAAFALEEIERMIAAHGVAVPAAP